MTKQNYRKNRWLEGKYDFWQLLNHISVRVSILSLVIIIIIKIIIYVLFIKCNGNKDILEKVKVLMFSVCCT